VPFVVFTAFAIGTGLLLTAGLYGWRSLAIPPGCGSREFTAQTPANFSASDATGALRVDTLPYRFTDFEDVAFLARGDRLTDRVTIRVTIRGWYAPGAAGASGPIVILGHGIYSCRRDPVTLLPAAMLHRSGFGVLVIDLRNHGESDGDGGRSALGSTEFRDLQGAWDWLVAKGHGPARIGLFGTSLSGASALIAMGDEPRIAATWADSSFASVDDLMADTSIADGFPGWLGAAVIPTARLLGQGEIGTRSPDRALATLAGRPLDIVHGLEDRAVLPHHALDLAVAAADAGTGVEPWLVPGAGHQQAVLLRPSDYEARMVAFFSGALGGP
jgi:fermentation-respiration switch protein FrsA (DUF1100 family)